MTSATMIKSNSSSKADSNNSDALLLKRAAVELERLRSLPNTHAGLPFPPHCWQLVRTLAGNRQCVDCHTADPTWASVTYGCCLCINCSGKHRSYGVNTSFVRSIDMDSWTYTQVMAMLEGGNAQLRHFFARHNMDKLSRRYHTKAALFYRTHLQHHIKLVQQAGLYQGREASRKLYNLQQDQKLQEQRQEQDYKDASRLLQNNRDSDNDKENVVRVENRSDCASMSSSSIDKVDHSTTSTKMEVMAQ